jgi:hypothetical protein
MNTPSGTKGTQLGSLALIALLTIPAFNKGQAAGLNTIDGSVAFFENGIAAPSGSAPFTPGFINLFPPSYPEVYNTFSYTTQATFYDPDGTSDTGDEYWEWLDYYGAVQTRFSYEIYDISINSWVDGHSTFNATIDAPYTENTYNVNSFMQTVITGNQAWYGWYARQTDGYGVPTLDGDGNFTDSLLMSLSATQGLHVNGGLATNGGLQVGCSLDVAGPNNLLHNQHLTSPKSILTKGLADGRYLSIANASSTYLSSSQASNLYVAKASPLLAIGNGSSATGTGSLALGTNALASATTNSSTGNVISGAIAVGNGAKAQSAGMFGSISIGTNSDATGNYSVALGAGARALGTGACSLGTNSYANGESVAIGSSVLAAYPTGSQCISIGYNGTTTSGTFAIALGSGAKAAHAGLSMGTGAEAVGSLAPYSSGIAIGTTAKANAASIAVGWLANAQTHVRSIAIGAGATTSSNDQIVLGNYNAVPAADILMTVGNGTADNSRSSSLQLKRNGNLQVTGTVTAAGFSGPIYAAPAGDISMGIYTQGNNP